MERAGDSQHDGPDMSDEILIEVEGLSKSYDGQEAVSDLDVRVSSGIILGLVGPNGAGKTTSLRCMAGIIPADRGRIVMAGHDLEDDAVEAKRRLSFVPDTPHLFDYLTVEEHLRFAGRLYGLGPVGPRIDRLLAEFELTDKRDHLPQALSRGMRQKVAICLGFLHQPRTILLDEPLTGLDPIGIRRMKNSITERAEEGGAAVIVSSHQLELVEELCDEILVIKEGRKVVQGTIASFRAEIEGLSAEPSLEEIFFRLTEGAEESSA